ncbi:hypothetical protein [Paludifilum halophilum]|uniref:Uncharacterized protein n=1 Tax=Paludifilum halophilum TaxID=1642702 RepID=A0A235BBF8_9BACL|nr:hypothetical protein [Paludifilum halophilum]OYD08895.1 hypothetical protein CHM34_03685 [Paludifilum halophilum]
MADSIPSKKDFADCINQLVGQNVMNEKKMDRLLLEAKQSYRNRGLDGFFEYVRNMTQTSLSDGQMRQLMESIKDSTGPEQALSRMVNQVKLSEKQAQAIENAVEERTRKATKRKRRRKK